MSAEVSFTKRAAAELSRCFNGLTSVNRSSSKKSTASTCTAASSSTATGVSASSPTSGVPSHASLDTGLGSLSEPIAAAAAAASHAGTTATAALKNKSQQQQQQSSPSEVTFLHTTSSSSNSTSSRRTLFGGQSSHAEHSSSGSGSKSRSSSAAASSGPGNVIQSSVQTLITKANTSLSPFKEAIHASSGAAAAGGGSEGQSSSRGSRSGSRAEPSTPSRRPSGPPPVAPRKTSIARRKNFLLGLAKPRSLSELSVDFPFLNLFFERYFSAKERTVLAQVTLFLSPSCAILHFIPSTSLPHSSGRFSLLFSLSLSHPSRDSIRSPA